MDEAFMDVAEEDEIFDELEVEDDGDLLGESDEVFQDDVDPADLISGYSVVLPEREVDVDEDTEYDDTDEVGDHEVLTEAEVDGKPASLVGADEIELGLDDVLSTGATEARAHEE